MFPVLFLFDINANANNAKDWSRLNFLDMRPFVGIILKLIKYSMRILIPADYPLVMCHLGVER